MRFQLPQFIETEVKIVGRFTLKQFLWVAGGSAIIFLLFISFKGYLFIIFALPVLAITGAFAFLKIDGISLIDYLAYFISYLSNPKRYIFKKDDHG